MKRLALSVIKVAASRHVGVVWSRKAAANNARAYSRFWIPEELRSRPFSSSLALPHHDEMTGERGHHRAEW